MVICQQLQSTVEWSPLWGSYNPSSSRTESDRFSRAGTSLAAVSWTMQSLYRATLHWILKGQESVSSQKNKLRKKLEPAMIGWPGACTKLPELAPCAEDAARLTPCEPDWAPDDLGHTGLRQPLPGVAVSFFKIVV